VDEALLPGRAVSRAVLAAQIAGLAALYFAAGRLGLSLAQVHSSASAVWPPTGLSIAALLLLGRGAWPGVFLGALAVNWTNSGNPWSSLGIALGNTLEGALGAVLVARFAGGRGFYRRAWDVFRFALVAGAVSPLVSATVGLASLQLLGGESTRLFGPVWATWYLGDAMGALTVAPFLLVWGDGWAGEGALRPSWSGRRVLEAAFLALSVLAVGWFVFGASVEPGGRGRPLTFLCMPSLVWAAFRFDARVVTTAALGFSSLAIAGTMHGLGAFTGASVNDSLLTLQAFLGVVSITALAVSAVVSEYRRTQAELRQLSIELRRSNEDLEQFAAIASHDLQEPLRMVTSYLQLLQKRAGRLAPDAEECIGFAVDGARRMRQLLDGLLSYARLESTPQFAPVDSGSALARALRNLAVALEETGATVSHGLLPRVQGDEPQLVQLFQNLVGNALKFTRRDAPARVHVEAREEGEEWCFSVRDNGIGIETQFRERIFVMFSRIHPPDEYTGTGVGLAICKKIVERHHGRIWVESLNDGGSAFLFTLPRAIDDPRSLS